MRRGGKRSGAGRKTFNRESKSASFATRITPEMRTALDAAARKNGRSLSQEVERRLSDSLTSNDRANRDSETAALAYLVRRMAQIVSNATGVSSWNSNRWAIETLKFAFIKLLDRMPTSNSDQPSHLEGNTPELLGASIAQMVWVAVERLDPSDSAAETYPEEFRSFAEDTEHTMRKVRRDLKIPAVPRGNYHAPAPAILEPPRKPPRKKDPQL
jgi:hypothetical protein